jgi:hypothetical protein
MRWLPVLLLAACAERPTAIVAADRDGFFFDRPFPSDELRRADGTVDLAGFPIPEQALAATMVGGWARMMGESATGFSALGPITFRLDGPVEVEPTYPGEPGDPIRLFSLDSAHQVPIEVRFLARPQGDPFLGPNTLVLRPDPRHALRSGERYAAVVDRSLARPPEGYTPPPELDGERGIGVATVFTVQDSLGQLRALRAATDAVLDANPEYLVPPVLREVASIRFRPATSPSGRAATECLVTYAEGDSQITWLADRAGQETFTLDLSAGPMRVLEGRITTVSWRPLDEAPWASPGAGFLSDFSRSDGAIAFGADGAPLATPEPEAMRVVVQVPREGSSHGLLLWDHGTAGHAYNAVQHQRPERRIPELSAAAAEAGWIVISRDQPLYGQRYPLIDEGFDASLGFYNIANLPAFRDNLRQGAVDQHVTFRFATEVLPDLLTPGAVDPGDVAAFGHSLGSITAHLGLIAAEGAGPSRMLASGAGGALAHFVTDTGLLGTDNDVVELLSAFVEAELPPDPTGSEAVGALLGLPEEAWGQVDAMHPVFLLFQTLMDPADPLAMAAHQPMPERFVVGIGDWQVPNRTTEWLIDALPDATRVDCHALSDYDPHHCTFVEDEGVDAVAAWLAGE